MSKHNGLEGLNHYMALREDDFNNNYYFKEGSIGEVPARILTATDKKSEFVHLINPIVFVAEELKTPTSQLTQVSAEDFYDVENEFFNFYRYSAPSLVLQLNDYFAKRADLRRPEYAKDYEDVTGISGDPAYYRSVVAHWLNKKNPRAYDDYKSGVLCYLRETHQQTKRQTIDAQEKAKQEYNEKIRELEQYLESFKQNISSEMQALNTKDYGGANYSLQR